MSPFVVDAHVFVFKGTSKLDLCKRVQLSPNLRTIEQGPIKPLDFRKDLRESCDLPC